METRSPSLANGVDRPYPVGHRDLLDRVADVGLLISEVPPGAVPTRHRVIARARLLAALSSASVIVEAGARSGSLLVAQRAAELGRRVGAVPGPVTSAVSVGPHRLLRDGIASLVADTSDLARLVERDQTPPSRARHGARPHSFVRSDAHAVAPVSGGRRSLNSARGFGELTQWHILGELLPLLPLRAVLTGASPYGRTTLTGPMAIILRAFQRQTSTTMWSHPGPPFSMSVVHQKAMARYGPTSSIAGRPHFSPFLVRIRSSRTLLGM